ncbi:MAG: SDR family oxidoreductase [Desulfobulbus sp.]|jgi:NAD(P)-dependent dehydrogenase (short-subunit alcohol dehydrogenase family)
MRLANRIVLVTGANRGIGQALLRALDKRQAGRIYAAARRAEEIVLDGLDAPERVVPLALDITDAGQVEQAARQCADVDVVINNAGINRNLWFLAPDGFDAARAEMEINFFGTLRMCRAFAPLLRRRPGSALVNLCSVLALAAMPVNGTYSASKAAVLSLIQSLRGELAADGVRVVGVYPGPVDTRLTAGLEMPKATPESVAAAIIDGIEAGEDDIFPDAYARQISAQWRTAPEAVIADFAGALPGKAG